MKKKKSYWTRLLRTVRQEWSRNNPDRKDCLGRAKLIAVDKLQKWECATCEDSFALSEVQVDHIEPVGNTVPQNKAEFLISFEKLHSDALQVLCRNCHKIKTKENEFEKRHAAAILNVSKHVQLFTDLVFNLPESHLQKFNILIKKMEASSENEKQKYLKQLDKLKEKYL